MKVIAYGSLLSRASLESVVDRPAPLSKVIVPGWKRVFNAAFDSYGFANIQADAASTIEAAYFELDPAEVRLFAEREARLGAHRGNARIPCLRLAGRVLP